MSKNFKKLILAFTIITVAIGLLALSREHSHTPKNNPIQVEFYICNTYDIPHMAPIIQELQKHNILVTSYAKKPKTYFKSDGQKKEMLDYYNLVLNTAQEYGLTVQDKSNFDANVVLTAQRPQRVRKYKHMKVKIGYGACPQINDNHQKPEFLEGFDGFLVHGQFEVDHYIHAFGTDHLKIMGAPKYDSFFQNPPDKQALKKKWNLLTDKKIILYLPTWNTGQSIDLFEHAIADLKKDYVIVTKPHNNTFRYNDYKYQRPKLDNMSTHLIDGSISLAELAIIADLLLTDIKSGATTEAIYLTQGNTPWIGLTSLSTSEYYPEVVASGPVLNDPAQLKSTVEHMFHNDTYHNQRIALNHYCYSNPSGPKHAATDAANAIIEFAHMQPISQHYPYLWKKLQRSFNKRWIKIKSYFQDLITSSQSLAHIPQNT